MRVEIPAVAGSFAKVAAAIGDAGGDLGAIDLVRVAKGHRVRDITVSASDADHGQRIVDAVRTLPGVRIVNVSDRTFLMHLGGKIEVQNKVPVKTRDDLSMAYTPGVARVCMAINRDPDKARALTIKQNTVAVVTDGTAVLGLGDIGPKAAMPVMEAGVRDVVGCDREGALHPGRRGLTAIKKWYARNTNPRQFAGTADEALRGADVFLGLSGPGAVSVDAVKAMADDAIVFAMAN